MAAVPQNLPADFDLTVGELVRLGRLPHQHALGMDSATDHAAALERAGIARLAGRRLDQLSGGERQRAAVARALAQQADVLLLDEPTNHLDIGAQHDLMSLIMEIDATTIVALHDLNLAAAYSDRALLLVEHVYRVGITRHVNPHTGRSSLMFHHAGADR